MDKEELLRLGQILSLLFLLLAVFFLLLFWTKLPPQLPLFYSHPWGEDQLSQPLALWLLPGSAALVFLGSLLINRFLKEEKLLIFLIVWSAVVFCFLSLLTTLKIIFLVI